MCENESSLCKKAKFTRLIYISSIFHTQKKVIKYRMEWSDRVYRQFSNTFLDLLY